MDLRIECLNKKYQPFSLSGVRFGSQGIQFLGEVFLFAKQITTYITYNTAITPLTLQYLYSQGNTYITYITVLT